MGFSADTLLRNPRRMTAALGAFITLIVLGLSLNGGLRGLQDWAFDLRVRHGQFFTPPPTDDLVFVMIDDAAVQNIDRWPWPRHKLAAIIDELNRSGAKVIVMDIIFPEKQPLSISWNESGQIERDEQGNIELIDNDQVFGQAIAQHGNVIVGRDGTPNPDDVEVVPLIEQAVAYTGSVKYRAGDKRLRSVPLVYADPHSEVSYVHSSAALAALFNGHDPSIFAKTEAERADSPQDFAQVPRIRVEHEETAVNLALGSDAYVPWFGPSGPDSWEKMFDWPKYETGKDHFISASELWGIGKLWREVHTNIDAMSYYDSALDGKKPEIDATVQDMRAGADIALRIADDVLAYYDESNEMSDEDRADQEKVKKIKNSLQTFLDTSNDIIEKRKRFEGKAVIIGLFMTGNSGGAFDTIQTPLHPICPGPVVLGTMFSAIQTGNFWYDAPRWITIVITLVIGLTMTWVAATQGPVVSSVSAVVLGGGYVLINMFALFDYGNVVVGLASPMTALVLAWIGCTVFRFLTERVERNRITARFRSYVDPALVDYVLEHPEKTTLDGEERELTVVFTDLAGFTTISEKLGGQTVPLVSEYLGRMVPIIQEQNGYVNKFLGDGMMFFYGAPLDNQGHAVDAVLTVLRMQKNLKEFNETLKKRGLPELGMRAGIGTGEMVVGDAGPVDRCDYTVLGDTVNLSARLESANKATGTWIMMNERTKELIGDRFLVRPVATLQVVGKSKGVRVFEPLAVADEATDEQKKLALMTANITEAYRVAVFDQCMNAINEYESAFGPCKLTALYREQSEHYQQHPPNMPFDERIVLTEK